MVPATLKYGTEGTCHNECPLEMSKSIHTNQNLACIKQDLQDRSIYSLAPFSLDHLGKHVIVSSRGEPALRRESQTSCPLLAFEFPNHLCFEEYNWLRFGIKMKFHHQGLS